MFLKEECICEIGVKKSRFICVLARVDSEDDFWQLLQRVKKDYPQATHYCTALKIESLARSSDDREPAGTAGRPMLDVLNGSKADHLGAVVVRYFGGTLLGKGGLVKAYSSAVKAAMEKAEYTEPRTLGIYSICADYEYSGKAEAWLHARVQDLECDYAEKAVYTFASQSDPNPALQEAFGGNLRAEKIGERIVEIPVKSCEE